MSTLRLGAATEVGEGVEAERLSKPGRGPREGDIMVCLGCGHVMIYADDHGAMRQPTDEEMAEIGGDRRVVAINNIRR
jgi:hypothetical protein